MEITPEVFDQHIKMRVRPEFRTFAAYKKAFPNERATLINGKLWRVTTARPNGVEFDNGQGRRIGSVKPEGKAFFWEIRDPSGRLIYNSQSNNPAAGGLFYTASSALRSLKKAADTFGS